MGQLDGNQYAFRDQGRAKSGSEAQKEHRSATVASQRLHGCIIDDFHRTLESSFEIKTYPTFCEVTRLASWPIEADLPGIADGYHVIFPVSGELLHDRNHAPGSQLRA